ncbi:MAG: chloride channel protein [Actinomycetes bacterium]
MARDVQGLLVRQTRLAGLGALSGVLAGLASAVFLVALAWATRAFDRYDWLLYLLPLGGLAVGLAYHYGGGRSVEGNNLVLDEIHGPTDWVPRRMAPMVLVGTVVTHLFGGSAGREGTAIQMSGSLTDWMLRTLRLGDTERRHLLVAALAGGFGSVFGVPFAGVVFGLEVQAVGGFDRAALVPCLSASFVGAGVVDLLGIEHAATPALGSIGLDAPLLLKVGVAGIAFGLVATVFARSTHLVKQGFAKVLGWMPARPLVGGALVVALTLLVGTRAYNGLSLPLVDTSFFGAPPPTWAFALKLAFTALTLGAGFVGGEVTPLFVIGATLGATLAGVLDVPVPFLAALGFVAVFGAAANTPLACTVMGVELFGVGSVPYLLVACLVAYTVSPHQGIYHAQRLHRPKPGRRRPGPATVDGGGSTDGPLPSAP